MSLVVGRVSVFADNLRVIREKKGITKSQMAKALKLTLPGYSYYEKGEREPGLTNLLKIAEVLNVPVETLLDGAIKVQAQQDEPSELELIEAIENWEAVGFDVAREEYGVIVIKPREMLADRLSPLELTDISFLRLTKKMTSLILFDANDKRYLDQFATMAQIVTNRRAALRRENPFNLIGRMVPLEYLPMTPTETRKAADGSAIGE